MIDLKKIHKLNNKATFKRFILKNKIDKPLYLDNYLFHYLIMYNILDALKFVKHPIYHENSEGLSGIDLAAKIGNETQNYKILNYILKNYEEYIYNINSSSLNFLNYMTISNQVYKLIKDTPKIDWLRLLMYKSKNNLSFMSYIFNDGSFKFINFIYDNYVHNMILNFKNELSYEINYNSDLLTRLITNKKLKNSDIINIFDKIDNEILNDLYYKGNSLLTFCINYRNIELLKYFVEKKDVNIDIYDNKNYMHILIISYKLYREQIVDIEMVKYIWRKIKNKHNWNNHDYYGRNIAYALLLMKLEYGDLNKSPSKLELEILSNNKEINKMDIDKGTIISLLLNFNFKKYHKILKGKNIDFNQKNNDKTIIEESFTLGELIKSNTFESKNEKEWTNYFKKLKNKPNKYKICDDVVLKNYKFTNHNIFNADYFHLILGFIHLDEKYERLYLPKNIAVDDTEESFGTLFSNILDNRIKKCNNFPYIIYWRDENNYFIHPMLNLLIKNASKDKKYDFATVFVSVDDSINGGNLHANILIYNFINNTIEFFEPDGSRTNLIHTILKEELCWDNNFKYLEPSNYMPHASFQYLAFENNELNLKPGDFGGYCLGWCYWYLEHRMLNSSIESKVLVPNLINKLIKNEFTLVEYIRNYANSFHKNIIKILKKIGIKEKSLTNKSFNNNEYDLIFNYIVKKTILTID